MSEEKSKEEVFCENLANYIKVLNSVMHPDEVATTQRKILDALMQNLLKLHHVPKEEKKDEEQPNS